MDKQILETLIDMHNTIKKIHLKLDKFKKPTLKVGKKGGLPGYFTGQAGANGESGPLFFPQNFTKLDKQHGASGNGGSPRIARIVGQGGYAGGKGITVIIKK